MTDLAEAFEQEDAGQPEMETGMSDAQYLTAVRNLVTDAEDYLQNEVSPERLRAQRYYNGECDVKPEPNRSKFVQRVVRDNIEMTVPQVMRIFTGGDDVISFRAKSIDERQQSGAEDATESANHIFWNKCDGWSLTETLVRDALTAKNGNLKVVRKERKRPVIEVLEGLPEPALAQLEMEFGDDFLGAMAKQVEVPGYFGMQTVTLYDAEVKRIEATNDIVVENVAPEEFLINRSATSLKYGKFRLVGQKSIQMVADAVDMGVDPDEAVKWAGSGTEGASGDYQEAERRARRQDSSDQYDEGVNDDPMTQPLVIYELYVFIDKDEDGVPELRRTIGIGEGPGYIVEDEITDDHPYCSGPAIAKPHQVIGASMADQLMDLQDLKTQGWRGILDNLKLHNNPRRWAVKGQYDRKALLDDRFNGVFEVDSPSSIGFHQVPFIGDKALLVMAAVDDTTEKRSGVSDEAMGLNAENMQSTPVIGVKNIIGTAQTQLEMMAGTLARSALVPTFEKIVALLKEGGEPLDILSDGTYREVNPQEWPEEMDTEVLVGLGSGTRDEKIQALQFIASQQKEIIMTAGVKNPWVTPEQAAYPLHKLVSMTGLGASTKYFNSPEEVKQAMEAAAAQQEDQPDPKTVEVQGKLQLQAQKQQGEMQLKAAQAQQDAALARDKAVTEAETDMAVAQVKIAAEQQIAEEKIDREMIQRMVEMEVERTLAMREQDMKAEIAREQGGPVNLNTDTNISRD